MNPKIILTAAVVFLLLAGIAGSVYLTQRQTQLKSRAASLTEAAPIPPYRCYPDEAGNPEPIVGHGVGRGTTEISPGCYQTAYAHWIYDDSEGNSWCDNSYGDPPQCLSTGGGSSSGGTALSGNVALSPTSIDNGGTTTVIVSGTNAYWNLEFCNDINGCSSPAMGWSHIAEQSNGQPKDVTTSPIFSTAGPHTIALMDQNKTRIVSQTTLTINSAAAGSGPAPGGGSPTGGGPQACTYILEGDVKDQNESPVGGVKVCLDPPGGGNCDSAGVQSRTTNPATSRDNPGKFHFDNVSQGAHNVYLQMPSGYKLAAGAVNPIPVGANSTCQSKDIGFFRIESTATTPPGGRLVTGTAPTVTNNIPDGCINAGYNLSGISISWSSTQNPNVSQVQISTSSNFTDFYTKTVSGTDTVAPAGFTKGSSPLVMNPGTYYFRLFDGTNYSSIKSLTLSACTGANPPPGQPPAPTVVKVQYRVTQADTKQNSEKALDSVGFVDFTPGKASGAQRVDVPLTGVKLGDIRFVSVQFKKILSDNSEKLSQPFTSPLIKYTLPPSADSVDCHQAISGNGTIIDIKGANLGQKGTKGAVRAKGKKAAIDSANWKDNEIVANLENERLDGENDVEITLDDGTTLTKQCVVGVDTVVFDVKQQCRPAGKYDLGDVDVKIYANVPASQAVPLLTQKIKTDNRGHSEGFAPKLEKGKPYALLAKAVGTIARKATFDTTTGTANVTVTLPAGDIAPVEAPDGVINTNDSRELFRRWRITASAGGGDCSVADLNGDGVCNSIDWSCMRRNFNPPNNRDDVFVPPVAGTPGGSGATTATLQPAPVLTLGTVTNKVDLTRDVVLSWTATATAIKYNVYLKVGTDSDFGTGAVAGVGGLSTTINLAQNKSYKIRVAACATADSCVNSNEVSLAINLPVISTISPVAVSPGGAISLTGSDFGTAAGTVNFYVSGTTTVFTKVTPTSWTDSGIQLTIPSTLTGGQSYDLEVATTDGRNSALKSYVLGP